MKHIYLLTLPLLCLALCACSSEDELTTDLEPSGSIVDVPSFMAPEFPANDGSQALLGSDAEKLNKLLKAIDPQRAMDRSMLEITDAQFEEIKAKADEVCASATTTANKINKLTEWVHNYVQYGEGDNNAYQIFKKKVGVCQGYSNLLHAMLLSQGIPSVGVNGYYVTSSQYYGHAWVYAANVSATTGKATWYVCDPTNSTKGYTSTSSSVNHLQPESADIVLFDDEQFEFKWQFKGLNISRVKKSDNDLVLPFSAGGYRVTMFNPECALPANVTNIYIGANINSLGETYNIIGLTAYRGNDEMCYVDPDNHDIGSANGVVYRKDYQENLTSIYYIPSQMTTITLLPMEKVEKNTILDQKGVEVIIFPDGTKYLEAYAIENCPNLRVVYVPTDCKVDKQAIYRCPDNVEVIYGTATGIKNVRL